MSRSSRFRFSNLAISGIHRILAGFLILVYVLAIINPHLGLTLRLDPSKVLEGQVWRLITGFIIPGAGVVEDPTQLLRPFPLLMMYFVVRLLFFMGDSIEQSWGVKKLNAVVFGTMLGVCVGVMIGHLIDPRLGTLLGASTVGALYMAIFLSFALEYPNHTFLLMLIIPVKVKWLGWLAVGSTIYIAFAQSQDVGSLYPLVHTVFSFAPLLFIALPRVIGSAKAYKRRTTFKAATEKSRELNADGAFHTCTTCGVSDKKDPSREFRVLDNGDEICVPCLENQRK